MLWIVIVLIFVFWLLGLIGHVGGDLIHILLVLVVLGVACQLIIRRRA